MHHANVQRDAFIDLAAIFPFRFLVELRSPPHGMGEPLPSDRSLATTARLQGERSEKRWQCSSRMRPLPAGGILQHQAERD